MKQTHWLIWRGQYCLTGFYGTYAQAQEYAYSEYGIGCSIVWEEI